MTRDDPTPDRPDAPHPADALPARTTPTWEIEILLSGASVFALFQLYDGLQRALFEVFERLSPEALAMWSTLGGYVQAGVLALALGFVAHLLIRAYWAAAVGLYSIDASGSLARTRTVGPAQRQMLADRWERLPQRIAELDDLATLVFSVSLGLAKVMGVLVLLALCSATVGLTAATLGDGRIDAARTMMLVLGLSILPSLVATLVDNHRGKRQRPALRWTSVVLRPYAAIGLTADGNLSVQMMAHRLSGGRRSLKGTTVTALLMVSLVMIVILVPTLQRVGVGALLKGDYPALEAGQFHALRAVHYLDRLPADEVVRAPAIPSEIATGPYLRLFIPYVPHWHDGLLADCRGAPRSATAEDWRHDAIASAATLRCLAEALPVRLDGRPVQALWLFAEDRRADRRGFVVMIDVRALEPGRYELQVEAPEAAFERDEPRVPWRIPFWR